MRYSKYVKRTIKAIVFVGIFVVLMLIGNMAFELDESSTEKMLAEYSHRSGLETIVLGSSVGTIFNANIYGNLTGERAFNMCTSQQGFEVSFKNIKLAAAQNPIDHVIILVTYDSFNDDDTKIIEHLYDRVVSSSLTPEQRIAYNLKQAAEYSTDDDTRDDEISINGWIPWTQEAVSDFDSAKSNLARRLRRLINGDRLGKDIVRNLKEVTYTREPGILTDEEALEFVRDVESIEEYGIPEGMINKDKLALLASICKYCTENNIKLSIIATPHKTEYFDRYDGFRGKVVKFDDFMSEFASKRDAAFFDIESDEELHKVLPDSFFMDLEHVDYPYGDLATEYYTNLIMINSL